MKWYTTYGEIEVEEQTFYRGKKCGILRPFMLSADVKHRGYSMLLQRRIVDFGADNPFGHINRKLEEHYGIEVPVSALRLITLKHAENLEVINRESIGKINNKAKSCVITETDGSMIPVVKTDDSQTDKRKKKELNYREVKLTLAHEKGSTTPIFSGTMGDAETAGKHIKHCLQKIGIGENTYIHGVGDGAPWIANQLELQFGAKGNYLIDFYHVCEYLAEASLHCNGNKTKWLNDQKRLLKEGNAKKVLLNLSSNIEKKEQGESPVRKCYDYLERRLHQLDYKKAIENDLPIGSGEIESAHRYIIQKRLKISGAWWLEKNAENMLNLRICRANNEWVDYWKKLAA